jgi:hypothetical protein
MTATTQAPPGATIQFRGQKYTLAGWVENVKRDYETHLGDKVFGGVERRAVRMNPILADRLLATTVADIELGGYGFGSQRHHDSLLIPENVTYCTFLQLHELDGSVTLELTRQMFAELGVKAMLDALDAADRIGRTT